MAAIVDAVVSAKVLFTGDLAGSEVKKQHQQHAESSPNESRQPRLGRSWWSREWVRYLILSVEFSNE